MQLLKTSQAREQLHERGWERLQAFELMPSLAQEAGPAGLHRFHSSGLRRREARYVSEPGQSILRRFGWPASGPLALVIVPWPW